MSFSNTAVVVSTHAKTLTKSGDWYNAVIDIRDQNFENFFVLFDNKTNKSTEELIEAYGNVNFCLYNEDDFKQQAFDKPIDTRHRWGSHQNPNYFYAHFRMLLFWLKNPHYDYYWFFDDDVTFAGDLKQLLASYENQTQDFIAIQVFKKEDYGHEFPFVSKANEKMGSNGNWLFFAPGPGDNYKSVDRHMGSFFPIVRFSRQALQHLYNVHQEGYYGYSEGFVPTTIASTPGFTVASMIDDEDNYFIKPNSNCQLFHKHFKFTWTWI